MQLAAEELYSEYKNNKELTEFTNLDLKIFMKQGEILLINLDPTIGAEIRKIRPAIIVNDNALDKLPLKIIVTEFTLF